MSALPTNLHNARTTHPETRTDLSSPNVQNSWTALIRANLQLLRQSLALIHTLNQTTYANAPALLPGYRVGSHMRHVLDFYDALLRGIPSGYVDYDARHRDQTIEQNLFAATVRIERVIQRLSLLQMTPRPILVRLEGAGPDPGHPDNSDSANNPWLPSSIERELLAVSSHTIHHFALIAIILGAHGVPVDPDFGVAPATLAYRRKRAAGNATSASNYLEQS